MLKTAISPEPGAWRHTFSQGSVVLASLRLVKARLGALGRVGEKRNPL
jgi:hypothetical protein